jgi:hypothetical protein
MAPNPNRTKTQLPPILENPAFGAQNMPANLNRITTQLRDASALLANQGTVVATWRKSGGSLTGPYYKVSFRENGARRSIYLGRDEHLAAAVRHYLAELQHPRILRRLRRQIRRSLRQEKDRLNEILNAHGYYIKGFEIRKQTSERRVRETHRRLNKPPQSGELHRCATRISSLMKPHCSTDTLPVNEKAVRNEMLLP